MNKRVMRKISRKKGISPVVASVLLISIVIILAVIIFLWAKGFVSEKTQKFEQAVEFSCDPNNDRGVNFEVGIYNNGTYWLDFVNKGNTPIYGVVVKEIDTGSVNVKELTKSLFGNTLNLGESRTIELKDLSSSVKQVLVVPIILGKSGSGIQAYTCDDSFGYTVEVK